MGSAVRWFEAETSGQFDRAGRDLALRRCVVPSRSTVFGTSGLPGSLSAALRSTQTILSSWNVVPVRTVSPQGPMEPAVQGLTHLGVRAQPAVVEVQLSRSVTGLPRQPDPPAVVGWSRSRITSAGTLAKRPGGSSAASVAVLSTAAGSITSNPSAAMERVAAKPSVLAGLAKKQVVAGRDARLASTRSQSSHAPALQRAAGGDDDVEAESGIVAGSRSQMSSAALLAPVVKMSGAALDSASSRRGSALMMQALHPAGAAASEADVRSQIKRPILSSPIPLGMIGSATRASSYDRALWRHDVVPRRASKPGGGTVVQQAGDTSASAYRAPRRDHGRQDHAPSDRISASTGSSVGQGGQAGMMVALRGDVLMDGRKMGRLVATGQTSAASLPTSSGSAINLRAIPIFSGTGAPL